ncbi:uncharacterized protein LOC132950732 isoform X2 [Metopolophium dirhodum]|uniref:uncharacterized protein LOC132950732 isoform X2 n=1 Tax=Metopolophium dirhodum TaxID=44670 RepID=UPI00298FD02C|nr:uncharacterized protein LOC132950732 isoform X2 [Metopolophium dirhodum]
MSDDFITFNIRFKKSLFELKIKTPGDVSGFIEKLKNELKLEETDDLVILCPTPDGKMMEIHSDDDIEFLKMLSNKIDKLASKIDGLSDDFTKKIDENKTSTFSSIRSILAEHLDIGSGNKSKNNSLGEEDLDIKSNLSLRQKKIKKDKEKLSSTAGTNDNSSTTSENLKLDAPTTAPRLIPKDIDVLLEMLVADGYTNTIQNIIVLKRFDNNYEKAKNYLMSSAT